MRWKRGGDQRGGTETRGKEEENESRTSSFRLADWERRREMSAKPRRGRGGTEVRTILDVGVHPFVDAVLGKGEGVSDEEIETRWEEDIDNSPDLNQTPKDGSDHLRMEHDPRRDLHVWKRRKQLGVSEFVRSDADQSSDVRLALPLERTVTSRIKTHSDPASYR